MPCLGSAPSQSQSSFFCCGRMKKGGKIRRGSPAGERRGTPAENPRLPCCLGLLLIVDRPLPEGGGYRTPGHPGCTSDFGSGVQQVSRSARRREEVYHTAGEANEEKEPSTESEGNRAHPQPPRFRIYNGELSRYLLTLRTRLLYPYVRPGKPGHTLIVAKPKSKKRDPGERGRGYWY